MILIIIIITIVDYFNLPTLLGLNMTNINWSFYMGVLDVTPVLLVFIITYNTLDNMEIRLHENEILKENNKKDIVQSILDDCYRECDFYVKNVLNDKTVKELIVPKINFDSKNNKIINNLQNAPFYNECIILDFIKDGQLTNKQASKYFSLKNNYSKYVNMRIIFFDCPQYYVEQQDKLMNNLKELLPDD